MVRPTSKGIALFIVLSMILVVVILANVILTFILSQSKLTLHQTNRIQAYYAAQAGINYALDKLRSGVWSAAGTYTFCRSGCDINDADLPITIQQVNITVGDPINNIRPIRATVTYVTEP